MLTILFFIGITHGQNAEDKQLVKEAEKAKMAMIDKNPSLQKHFDEADAYVIFPNVGEGAFIIGGASGNGAVWENGTLIGLADMKKIDVGAQIGGAAYSEVIFFDQQEPLKRFKDDDFELSASMSAVLIKEGASLAADYSEGVAVFVMPKAGLSLEAAVGGQQFEFIPLN
ncbi:MAG: hypothetical protein CMC08_01055 [Flavobacteriaceae bacterium]|nr:hypothetical protein [Flavobacteriaceae bacterium]